jgi:hypothetical protein
VATKAHQEKFLARSLTALPDKYLDCRDPSTGHDWKLLEDYHVTPLKTVGRRVICIQRKFQCDRCSAVKTERYTQGSHNGVARLERLGVPSIDYPEGYQIPGVPRGVKPAEVVRAEQYRRSLEKAVKAKRGQRATAER